MTAWNALRYPNAWDFIVLATLHLLFLDSTTCTKNNVNVPKHDDEEIMVTRPTSPALEAILGRRLSVLDDGFVRVVDYMGNDGSIVQAARVSYGEGTKVVREDRALIRYLLRHRHTTPFEMCEIKLHVRVPMDTWRQWIRHRTANVNEYSTRYSIAIDSAQRTPSSAWRLQAKSNRQGSQGVLPDDTGAYLSERERKFHEEARALYEERLSYGVAREQARKDLPLSTYTEAYWKIDLYNLLHFLSLRMDDNAQFEIRQYADVIGASIVADWVPLTWEAFVAYRLRSITFSSSELDVLRLSDTREPASTALLQLLTSIGWLERDAAGNLKANRESAEFVDKYRRVYGVHPTWLT